MKTIDLSKTSPKTLEYPMNVFQKPVRIVGIYIGSQFVVTTSTELQYVAVNYKEPVSWRLHNINHEYGHVSHLLHKGKITSDEANSRMDNLYFEEKMIRDSIKTSYELYYSKIVMELFSNYDIVFAQSPDFYMDKVHSSNMTDRFNKLELDVLIRDLHEFPPRYYGADKQLFDVHSTITGFKCSNPTCSYYHDSKKMDNKLNLTWT